MKLLPYEPTEDWVSGPRERRYRHADQIPDEQPDGRWGLMDGVTPFQTCTWRDYAKCARCRVPMAGEYPEYDGKPHCCDCEADAKQDALDAQEATP